jgi:Domain of unknown function (DUF202)
VNSTQDTDVRDHLAAERTFLAWIRTGIALMGFGFVVARSLRAFPTATTGGVDGGLEPGYPSSTAGCGLAISFRASKLLKDIPSAPIHIFCATDLACGVNWMFKRQECGDYQVGFQETPDDWRVSTAVAASSCFPPVFRPLDLDLDPTNLTGGKIPPSPQRDKCIRELTFSDGGVYDNLRLGSISSRHYAGIGDKGLQSGYTAVADHIRVGELEFQDCLVSVSDKGSVADEDGLIGADVFGAYLIDIDLPAMRLRVSPLPKRAEETVAPTSLNSEGEEQANAEQKESNAHEQSSNEQPSPAPNPKPAVRLPKDRYIAPEMANWTKVFCFGHSVLVPTSVNESKPMLFGLDTGAFSNILSVRAGRQVSKVSSEERMQVRGLNGEVKNVYSRSVLHKPSHGNRDFRISGIFYAQDA